MRARLLAVSCVLAVGLGAVSPASAHHRPPTPSNPARQAAAPKLVFEDERPLTAAWSRLVWPVRFDICNLGVAPATAEAKLVGFDFQRLKKPLEVRNAVSLTPKNLRLRARTCRTATLRRGTMPDAGEYHGVIVVRGTPKQGAATLVRRELTVTLQADDSPKPKPLKAVADEVVLRATRNGPFGGGLKLDEPASLPLAVRGSATAAPPPPPDTVIGVLMNGESRAKVIVDGELTMEDGVPVLPIRLEAHSPTGTYTGTVDLATGDADPSSVRVKIEASDSLPWALGAVLLGVLGATGLTWLVQKWLPHRGLSDRRADLLDRYRRNKTAFAAAYGETPFAGYGPDEDNVRSYQAAVAVAIKRWSKDNLLVDREGDDFKGVVLMLQNAEADADLLGDAKGFGAALTELASARDAFVAGFPNTAPKFMRHAVDRLEGKLLPVGGATTIAGEAKAYVALADDWAELARRLKRLDLWIELLRKKALTAGDIERVDEAGEKVAVARRQLLDAADAEQLAEQGVERKLERAYDRLTGPGVRERVWYPSEEDVAARPFDPQARPAVTFVAGAGIAALARAIGGYTATVLHRASKNFVQLLVVALGVVTAILVGLPTVLSDDTFGSWPDYLAAFALGAASCAGAKGIFEAWQQLRRRERIAPAA